MIARRTARPLVSTAVALALGVPAAALGQEVGPYDPLGIRAGSFLIFPSLGVSELYDDNIFAVDNHKEDDFITLVHPEVRAQSNFSRHSVALTAGSDIGFYADHNDEDFQDFFVTADTRLDISRQNNLSTAMTFSRGHQGRDDPEDNPNASLVQFYRYGPRVSFYQTFNRLNFRLTGGVVRTDYENNEDGDRDQYNYTANLRTGFFVSPSINTFVQGTYDITDRDQRTDDAGIERNSQGWGASGGAEVSLTDLLVGDFFVGYTQESYAQDNFDDESGVGYGLDLTWTPTRLTTVTLSGGGNFRPTTQQDAESNFRSTAGVTVSHDLLRNVRIGGALDYIRDDFKGDNRTDDQVNAGANASYLLNRYFSIDAGYVYSRRWSDLNDEGFTRSVVRLGVTGRL